MAIRCHNILGTLVATTILYAAASELAMGLGVGAYDGMRWADGMYDPWLRCTPPYRCRDPIQLRVELERYGRLQDLRERATPSKPHVYPDDGPWGPQRYIPPATPESNIRPAYRGTSKLRPEYKQAGQPVDEPAAESRK